MRKISRENYLEEKQLSTLGGGKEKGQILMLGRSVKKQISYVIERYFNSVLLTLQQKIFFS